MITRNYTLTLHHAAQPSKEICLPDGCQLRLQELRPEDREPLKAFYANCSSEALYYRFLSPIKLPSSHLLDYLVARNSPRQVALSVTEREGNQDLIVAEGRYVICDERPAVADIALLVADRMRRRGIATLLVHELVSIACRNQVTHFSADVLADNRPMLALLRKIGPSLSSRISGGVIHFEIPIICREVNPASAAA